jgi:hypothetical protein
MKDNTFLYNKFPAIPKEMVDIVADLNEEQIKEALNADPDKNPYIKPENTVIKDAFTIEN